MSNKIKFSVEQQKAIESKEKNLLVSASAGSGKTKVLIERIVRLIKDDNVELSKMLVVTFTKLASLEMKSRLKKELEQECQTNANLLSQLDEINIANISTLHQFCHNVIKEFFYVLQIEPNFNLLDDVNASFYKTKAVENVFKNYSQKQDDDFESLYEIFYDSRNDKNFKRNVISIYNFLQSKSGDFFSNSIESCYSTNFDKNPAILYIQKVIGCLLDHYIEKFNLLVLLAEQIGSDRMLELTNQAISRLVTLKNSDFASLYTMYDSTKFISSRFRNLSPEETEINDQLKILKDKFAKDMKSLVPCFYINGMENLAKDFDVNKKYLNKFYEVINEFDKEYRKLKQDKNSLDFNDLEHYALKALSSPSVQKEMQSRFDYIFIDEYQDTNEVQEEIISRLTSNFTNIFMVGDVKQSIYAFRECNPQIFIKKEKQLLNNTNGEVIRLNANYRSDKDILNFNNLVFDNVMREQTCGIDYQNTSKFIFGESFTRSESKIMPVNLCFINTQKKAEEETDLSQIYSVKNDNLLTNQDTLLEKEALLVADKISALLETKIFDNDTKQERNIQYKDIALLTRTKEAIKQIAKVLMQKGIPVNAEYKVNLFSSYEVKLIIEFLKLLQNSNDDIALSGVLKSPLYNLTDTDLILIKQANVNMPFYGAVENYAKNNDDELSSKLRDFYQSIEKYRQLLEYETISRVVRTIITDYDVLEKFFATPNYLEVKENLQFFVNSIASIDDNNLSAFLNYIENYTDEKQDLLSIKNSVNSVYIGTFHSSKGLEYPAVFVVGLEKNFFRQSITEKLIKNSELGLGLSTYDIISKFERNSIIKNIMKYQVLEKEKQEEMRLLYVALTRPKCYLFVVAGCDYEKLVNLDDEYSITHAKSHLDYIVGSLGKDTLNNIVTKKQNIIAHYENLDVNIELFDSDKIINSQQESNTNKDNNISYLVDYFNKEFSSNDYAFKNTVTALMQNENEQIDNYNIKNLKINLSKDDEQDFLLIGNNYHKIMQMLDFKSSEPVLNQIDMLKTNGILCDKDCEFVDIKKIETAFKKVKTLIDNSSEYFTEKQFMFYPKLCDVLSTNLTNNVLLQGVIDLMIVNANEIFVVDYKTSRISSEKGFIDKYHLQLELYSKAIESFYKKPVTKKIIYSFYLDELIIIWQLQKISIIIVLWLMRKILIYNK